MSALALVALAVAAWCLVVVLFVACLAAGIRIGEWRSRRAFDAELRRILS